MSNKLKVKEVFSCNDWDKQLSFPVYLIVHLRTGEFWSKSVRWSLVPKLYFVKNHALNAIRYHGLEKEAGLLIMYTKITNHSMIETFEERED